MTPVTVRWIVPYSCSRRRCMSLVRATLVTGGNQGRHVARPTTIFNPGVPAETPEDMVVACRSATHVPQGHAGWAVDLLAAPKTPPYFECKRARLG